MPLPTIETPTYELKLPSTNKKIKYRPFLVKEEKILILALESKSQNVRLDNLQYGNSVPDGAFGIGSKSTDNFNKTKKTSRGTRYR